MNIRNPLKTSLTKGAPIWRAYPPQENSAGVPALTRRYIKRIQKKQFTHTSTPDGTDEVWCDIATDRMCRFTEQSVVIGRQQGGREPYVYFSFLQDETDARADIIRLMDGLRAEPAPEHPIVTLVARVSTLLAGDLPVLDGNQRLDRMDRAARLREFAKAQQLPELSVTVPHGAVVDVRLANCNWLSAPDSARNDAYRLMQSLIDRLFPANRNIPDPYSDYYGHLVWSLTF